jgi:hypothetical protein
VARAPHIVVVFGELEDSIDTSMEEKIAMFLHVVRHNQWFRVLHRTSRRSMEAVFGYFQSGVVYRWVAQRRHD